MISSPHLYLPRRRFLQTVAGSAAALALPSAWGAEDDGKTVTVSILNTTDLHGHIVPTQTYEGVQDVGGMARCVTQIRKWQKENPNNILIDIGDVYQGTHVSRSTGGAVMIDLFNRMNYDAWVMGNHEFDWGLEAVVKNVAASKMPVLAANAQVGGKWANTLQDKSNPLSRIAPYIIKEVAGFRIGIVGVVTPGLPAWLHPSLLREFSAADPLGSTKFAIRKLKDEKVDAIVLACHFGLKNADVSKSRDDFANRVFDITKECRDLNVVIAGHTHRDIGSARVNDILYTQASYHGIHAGKTDLVFDKESRRLVETRVGTVLMDKNVEQDAMVLSATSKEREASDAELKKPIGELAAALSCKAPEQGGPAPALLLVMKSIRHAMEKRGVKPDGVLHGLFMDEKDLAAGPKTVADAWEIIPYENRLTTAEFRGSDLAKIMQEAMSAPYSTMNLEGFKVTTEGERRELKVTSLTLPDGKPVEPDKRYLIALNGFDAQSGGRRYPLLQELSASSDAKLTLHSVESRDAVIEFFTEKKTVRPADLGL
jgi:2',3'-cyclic-nucleotide 2'-phosphodiesterase (5'-nucleotidase family)